MNLAHGLDPLREHDQQTRQVAQREFRTPLVIEAGAGTGKTTILTARMVAWCLGPGWERAQALDRAEHDRVAVRVLEKVAAITFTDAAAAEMAARVGEALSELERGGIPFGLMPEALPEPPELCRSRARALLGSLDHLVVMTIHAFCLRLLAQYPMEAGLHPGFTVDADGMMLEQVVREVVEDALKEAYGDPGDVHFLALAADGHGPQEIADALVKLASEAVPSEALQEDPFSPERVQGLYRPMMGVLEDFLDREGRTLEKVKGSSRAGEVVTAMKATLEHLEILGAAAPDLPGFCAAVRGVWSEKVLERLRDWEAGRFNQGESKALGSLAAEMPGRVAPLCRLLEHVGRVQPQLLDHARLALGPLLEKVHEEMRSRGFQTFMGLLRDARDLLAHCPEVRRRVRRSMDQLLVDEFQDTDRLQCDIIRMIALDGPEDARPGLFLVGDPKQSIYGWRSADLEAYDDFVAELLASGGQPHPLAVNFRSAPVILEEVERVIRPAMQARRGLQPPFQPLVPCPERVESQGFAIEPRAPIEYWVSWARGQDGRGLNVGTLSAEAAELEADALARDILSLHDQHAVPWQEVGVLFRSTGDLDTYLSAFRQAGIPYMVARDKNYYRRREIIEAAALVRAILDPHDHVALITLLRSSMVGVPDAAWIPLWSRSFPERVTELRGEDADQLARIRAVVEEAAQALPQGVPGIQRVAGWERALLAAVQSMGMLRECFERDAADEFVARMRSLFLVEPVEAARYLGPYRLANLDRFFRYLTHALDQGGGDPHAVLRALRAGVAQALEAEEGRPKEAAEEAVQVMTIHKAKGLDFQHVYVMQLHKGSRADDLRQTAAAYHAGQWEYVLAGAPTLGFAQVLERDEAVASAEMVRTLYVAMTRAKDRLVLAGRWPGDGSPKVSQTARTHMDLLRGRDPEPVPLAGLLEEIERKGNAIHEDATEARWVFQGLAGPDCPVSLESAAKVQLPSPERVRQDAEALAARVKAAQALMARPFSEAASKTSHEALREIFVEGRDPEDGRSEAGEGGMGIGERLPAEERRVAMAVGSAIHRVLECFDLEADLESELERQASLLPGYLTLRLPQEGVDEALSRARSLLERFAKGELFETFLRLKDNVIARELPVLLPPPSADEGPVGFIAGAVDLLYLDPETGELVVADYKTDEVNTSKEIAERAEAYVSQGAVYVRGVQEALGLPTRPRFELWFLHPGRIEIVCTPTTAGH